MKFYTRYNWQKPVTSTGGASRTEQHHKDDCDINFLLKRIRPAELREHLAGAFFGDVSQVPTNAIAAMDFARDLEDRFADIPVKLRQRYGMTPDAFVRGITTASQEQLIADNIIPQPEKPAAPEVRGAAPEGAQSAEA